jgi:hypothetical protein
MIIPNTVLNRYALQRRNGYRLEIQIQSYEIQVRNSDTG